MLGHGARRSAGSRRDIDLQCLLRYIATPITIEPSAHLPLPSTHARLFLSLTLPVSLFRSHPVLSLISSPYSATLVSDYQYRRRYILPFSSLSFSLYFFSRDSSRMMRTCEWYATTTPWPWPSVTAAPEFLSEASKLNGNALLKILRYLVPNPFVGSQKFLTLFISDSLTDVEL